MNEATRHFETNEWADYVRKAVTPERRQEMLAHLSSCSKCKKLENILARFATICLRESAYEVPRSAEVSVKGLPGWGKNRRSLADRLFGNLVFDSLRTPQPAGVRGTHQISRQVLFHAGDYSVDLRFEHEKGSASMVMVGQIANQKAPEELLGNVPVILFAGERELTRAISNSFGEFQLEYVPETDLRLLVPLESKGKEVEVSLGKDKEL